MTVGKIGTRIVKIEQGSNGSILMELTGPKGNLKLACNLETALRALGMVPDNKRKPEEYLTLIKTTLEGKILSLDFHFS